MIDPFLFFIESYNLEQFSGKQITTLLLDKTGDQNHCVNQQNDDNYYTPGIGLAARQSSPLCIQCSPLRMFLLQNEFTKFAQ